MRRFLAAATLVLIAACTAGGVVMEPMPPAPGWEESLRADRAARDRQMRTDPDTPLLAEDVKSFRGLAYWPPDPRMRFGGSIEINDRIERFTIVTTSGKPRPCEKYGRVRFVLDGRTLTLQVYRLLDIEARPGVEDLFLPFLDATSGKEAYAAGRYVDLIGPRGGPYELDFNRAYNPLCAYGAANRFACPVTPPENRLSVRIEAGEKKYERPRAEGL